MRVQESADLKVLREAWWMVGSKSRLATKQYGIDPGRAEEEELDG